MALRLWRRKAATKVGEGVETKAEGDVTFTPTLVSYLDLWDGTSASYGTIYRKLPPVRTVVDFLADNVASTPLKFYRREDSGRPEERDHPVAELLRRPNPGLTSRRLVWGTVADLAVYGQAYWRYIPARGRTAAALVPLPPYRVQPKGGDLVAPSGFEFWPMGSASPQLLSGDEVIHFHTYDPEDRRIGASKLQALKAILDEEVEASRHRKGFWANAARTGGWIEYPMDAGVLSPDQLDRLRESMQGSYGGPNNAGKVGVLERGGHFNRDGFSPKDSEFLAGRQFVLEATARVYGVPLPLLSMTETSTYASQREFHKQLYVDTLPPWYESITSEIELQLFPWFTDTADLYAEFVVESKLRGDFLEQADVLNKAVGRPWMEVGVARGLQNLPDRDEPRDWELVVPVGPNYALEGMAAAVPAPAPLAAVASMPVERIRQALVEFFAHQERSVASKLGAGKHFEPAEWDERLTKIVGDRLIATAQNLETAYALMSGDVAEVFETARNERAPTIARWATKAQEATG